MGFWGFDTVSTETPFLNLAQWQSKYITIVVLTICLSKQLYTTVVACMQLCLTNTIHSY